MEAGNIEIPGNFLNLPGIRSMVSKAAVSENSEKIRGSIRNLESLIELCKKLGVDNTIVESVIKQSKILVDDEQRYIEQKQIKEQTYLKEAQASVELVAKFIEEASSLSKKITLESQERQVRALEAAIELQKEQLRIAVQIQEAHSRILLISQNIEQNKAQIQQNKAAIRQSAQVLIDNGYIEKLQEICPSIPIQDVKDKFIACWSDDPTINRDIKAYNIAIAKALGVRPEQVEEVNAKLGVFETQVKARESHLEGIEKLETKNQALEAEKKAKLELIEQLEAQSEIVPVLKQDVMQIAAAQTKQPIETITAQVTKESLRQRLEEIKKERDAADDDGDDDKVDKLRIQIKELEQELESYESLSPPQPPTPPTPTPPIVPPTPTPTPPPSPAGPQATEKEASVKAAVGLLTLERACAILGYPAPDAAATPEAKKAVMRPMIKSCVDQGEKAITQIGKFNATLKSVDQPLANSMRQEFRSMMAELKKSLPIYDLDFTKPEVVRQKIKESVEKTLPTWEEFAKKSGIDIQAYNADKNSPKYAALKKAEEEFGHLRDAVIDLRVQQYAVGAEGMDIEAKDANSSKEWEARLSRLRSDKYYADIAALGLADENFAKEWHEMHKKLGPDAYLARLKSETKEVIENELFSKMDRAGNTVFIVKVVNEHTLQTVIEAKKDQKQIDWSNASRKDMPLIEDQCLANWKKVSFDGKETDLSKLMPERQADWIGTIITHYGTSV